MTKCILELSHKKAKEFFLTQSAFTNIDLPTYFNFQDVLKKVDGHLKGNEIQSQDLKKAKNKETVNYISYHNKDGKHSWRKFQIINPAIYVSLVNAITQKDKWHSLQNRFKEFQKIKNIKCESLPVIEGKKKQKGVQIHHWLENIEKKSIELALEYKFLYHADVSNCYSSIYTHSISWAIHGKHEAKKNRAYDLLGNKLDQHLQAMSHGQTNGIPEGSTLMDFIAEIVLGYADLDLAKNLEKFTPKARCYILRYRGDYRIFVDDISVGDNILKCLKGTSKNSNIFLINRNAMNFKDDFY